LVGQLGALRRREVRGQAVLRLLLLLLVLLVLCCPLLLLQLTI
jgi:hypothetical protein